MDKPLDTYVIKIARRYGFTDERDEIVPERLEQFITLGKKDLIKGNSCVPISEVAILLQALMLESENVKNLLEDLEKWRELWRRIHE